MKWFVLALFGFLVVAPAHAASFDCSKAETQIEKLICGNNELSVLDDKMGKAFQRDIEVESSNLSMFSIKDAQHQWLKLRNSCPDAECIKEAYLERLAQLQKIFDAEGVRNSKSINSDNAVCQTVAGYANALDFDRFQRSLGAPKAELDPQFGDLTQVFNDKTSFGGTGDYLRVDLNGDGVSEFLTIHSDGTMNDMTAYVISSKQGSTTHSLNDDEDGNLTLSLIKVGSKYFVLSSAAKPGKLWRVNKHGTFQLVCEFLSIRSKLVIGKKQPVCAKVEAENIKHIDYPYDNHVEIPDVPGPWSSIPLKGLAKIDLVNEGQVQNVVRIESDSSAGAGCSLTYLATTDKEMRHIPNTTLNKKLRGMNPFSCGSTNDIFMNDEQAYIDYQDTGTGNRAIHKFFKGQLQTICGFRGEISARMARGQ